MLAPPLQSCSPAFGPICTGLRCEPDKVLTHSLLSFRNRGHCLIRYIPWCWMRRATCCATDLTFARQSARLRRRPPVLAWQRPICFRVLRYLVSWGGTPPVPSTCLNLAAITGGLP